MFKTMASHRSEQGTKNHPSFENIRVSGRGDGGGDTDVNENGSGEESVPEKDETEKNLERLLFGDDEGFHSALKEHQEHGIVRTTGDGNGSENAAGEEEMDERDLSGVPDADLFFLDSGIAPASANLGEPPTMPLDGGHEDVDDYPAVWHDSDDEHLTISLASHQRLRKLRLAESEDVIGGEEYVRRLRRQFQRLHPVPEWADPEKQRRDAGTDSSSDADDMDTDDGEEQMSTQPLAKLLQGTTDLVNVGNEIQNGKRKLRQEVLDIQRLKDIGGTQPSSIDSLAFHPHYPVLLSSGPASTLFLHHISPDAPMPNPLLTTLHIRRTPIHTSAFAQPGGNKIFASGRRRYFHIWDLDTGKIDKVNGSADRRHEQKSMEKFKLSPCGRYIGLVGTSRKGGGLVNILDSDTAQWTAQVRVDGRGGVADFAWWADGEGMSVVSKNGEVSEWDGRRAQVIARWTDEGAVGTTTINLGGLSGRTELGGDRWAAVGSSSGIVNIYDRREWAASHSLSKEPRNSQVPVPRNPKPVRSLDQLTTPVSHLIFSPDGQMLVMASRWKRDALRIVHLPSCTVYRNWPTSNTPLGRISSVAVSSNSSHLAVGNEQGRIRLWEIRG